MSSRILLEPNAKNVAAAREFLLTKWRERAHELGQPKPADLSGSCKFTTRFAREVFGGQIRGNFFHQWVELNGEMLDLNEHAQDVSALLAGRVPEDVAAYAKICRQTPPEQLYTHNELFMSSAAHRESMASVSPRVTRWVDQFRILMRATAEVQSSTVFSF